MVGSWVESCFEVEIPIVGTFDGHEEMAVLVITVVAAIQKRS